MASIQNATRFGLLHLRKRVGPLRIAALIVEIPDGINPFEVRADLFGVSFDEFAEAFAELFGSGPDDGRPTLRNILQGLLNDFVASDLVQDTLDQVAVIMSHSIEAHLEMHFTTVLMFICLV